MAKPVLEFQEVTKRYGDFTAVDRMSFTLSEWIRAAIGAVLTRTFPETKVVIDAPVQMARSVAALQRHLARVLAGLSVVDAP